MGWGFLPDFISNLLHVVSQGANDIRYKIVRIHEEVEGLQTGKVELIEDAIVQLGQGGSRFLPFEIRLTKAKNQNSGEVFTFLANIYQMSAGEICDLYKKRWSIGVFFKFIK